MYTCIYVWIDGWSIRCWYLRISGRTTFVRMLLIATRAPPLPLTRLATLAMSLTSTSLPITRSVYPLCLILVCCISILTTYLCAVNLLLLRIVCISVVLDTFAYHEVCISRSVYPLCLILVRCKSIVTTYSLLVDCVIVFDCTFTTGSAYPWYVCVAYPLIQQILLSFFVLFYDVLLLQPILFCLSCYVCVLLIHLLQQILGFLVVCTYPYIHSNTVSLVTWRFSAMVSDYCPSRYFFWFVQEWKKAAEAKKMSTIGR